MKKLIFKIFTVLLPAIIFLISVIYFMESSNYLREESFDPVLEGKIITLVKPDTDILIAGDSRAERQVIPETMNSKTSRKTVNIASSGCDLITLKNALHKYNLLSSKATVIISASLFQINDGAITPEYFSKSCFANMTFKEKLSVYKNDIDSLPPKISEITFKKENIKPTPMADETIQNLGFVAVYGWFKTETIFNSCDIMKNKHPWYKNLSLHGAKQRIFLESLEQLAASSSRIYIFLPPVSPAWKSCTADTFIDRGELEFAEMLRLGTAKHPNIQFLDFYTNPDPRLRDEMYYDIQHLNKLGAQIFTEILSEKIGEI